MSARRARGTRLIVTYKRVEGGAEVALGAVIALVLLVGSASAIIGLAAHVRGHVVGAWALRLAEAATPHRLWVLTLALVLDGGLTVFQAQVLAQGWTYGPWLVVATTAVLLPFEAVDLAHHPHVGRVVILVFNLAIVAYLIVRARRQAGPA